MKKLSILFILAFTGWEAMPEYRPNCEAYRYMGEACYEACQESWRAISYAQGSRASQERFDKAIDLCPNFAYAWHEKAVPYLKRGSFVDWKAMMDKAVGQETEERLGYRGWCRYQFLRDYQGAIDDIEQLEGLMKGYDIGYAQNGDCHLMVAKALCYKGLGQPQKALQVLQAFVDQPDFFAMPYDYLHLGVMYMEAGQLSKAEEYLKKQAEINPELADNYYYLSKVLLSKGNRAAAQKFYGQSKELREKGLYRKDPYTTPMDAVSKLDMAALAAQLKAS